MKFTTRGIRILLLIVFLLIAICALLSAIYWIWLTAFGVGWGGGDISLIELFWQWKGMILLFIYATITIIGLIKPRKIGLIFGYSITLAMTIYIGLSMIDSTIYDFKNNAVIDFSYIVSLMVGTILVVCIPMLSIIGLNRIKVQYFKLGSIDYLIIIGLTILLLLSWYFMFYI